MEKVYYIPLNDNPTVSVQAAATQKLATELGINAKIAADDFVALKFHIGEEGNTTHIQPDIIKGLVDLCHQRSKNVFLTETSTLYKGERENAVKHIMLAQKHGFGVEQMGAPFVMADGLIGGSEIEITINGELEKSVKIAREIAYADVLITVSHPTGHIATGLGACLKNLGMGLASRSGKLRQHSSVLPAVNPAQCRFCKKCIKWCPQTAIVETNQKAFIITDKCIGCGECLTLCRYDAISYDWGIESEQLQKSMVEHAYGVVKDKTGKCIYLNVLVGMTTDCDCFGTNQRKIIPDLGILASTDPVAIDKATLDLTEQANGKSLAGLAHQHLDPLIQLKHAVKLGMGSLDYQLVKLNA